MWKEKVPKKLWPEHLCSLWESIPESVTGNQAATWSEVVPTWDALRLGNSRYNTPLKGYPSLSSGSPYQTFQDKQQLDTQRYLLHGYREWNWSSSDPGWTGLYKRKTAGQVDWLSLLPPSGLLGLLIGQPNQKPDSLVYSVHLGHLPRALNREEHRWRWSVQHRGCWTDTKKLLPKELLYSVLNYHSGYGILSAKLFLFICGQCLTK